MAAGRTECISSSGNSAFIPLQSSGTANVMDNSKSKMKTIYFSVGERSEVAVFDEDTPNEDIKALFRSAAEAGADDILKMYTPQGSLVNISNRLESNQPHCPYRLQLVAAHYNTGKLADQVGNALTALEQRMCSIELKVQEHTSWFPPEVQDLRDQVNSMRKSLANFSTGCCKESSFQNSVGRPYWNRLKWRRRTEAEKDQTCEKFLKICEMTLSEEIRRCLRMPTFNNWQWEDEEILLLLQQMYLDLNFPAKFCIELPVLRTFLCQVYLNYNEVPFHNFQHCFCVSQMMYGIIWCLDLPSKIGDLETLILLTSCICHDLDHPGFNNIYQINARTELALRYNDISPLENHHCSVAFRILEEESSNIFRCLGSEVYKKVREGMIRCILATDMARHNEILNQFHDTIPVFDYANRAHVNLLCMVLIKVADISNEARPLDIAEPWLDCLLQEFFEQSDAEKLLGLPVTPFMDREKITKPSSQCSFIGFVLLPLFECVGQLFPELEGLIVNPVREALEYYRQLNEASKDTRSRRSLEPPTSPVALAQAQAPAAPDPVAQATADSSSHSSTVFSAIEEGDKSRKSSLESNGRLPSLTHAMSPRVTRWSSTEEESRRLSLGLDPDTTNEVEVSEKTLIFKIATESRTPKPDVLTRRASLAINPSDFNTNFQSRSHCTVSQPASPRYARVSIVEEDEVDDDTQRHASLKNGVRSRTSNPDPESSQNLNPDPSVANTSVPDPKSPSHTTLKSSRLGFFSKIRTWKEKLSPVPSKAEDFSANFSQNLGSPRLGARKVHTLSRFLRRSFRSKSKDPPLSDKADDTRPSSATPSCGDGFAQRHEARKLSGSLGNLPYPINQ